MFRCTGVSRLRRWSNDSCAKALAAGAGRGTCEPTRAELLKRSRPVAQRLQVRQPVLVELEFGLKIQSRGTNKALNEGGTLMSTETKKSDIREYEVRAGSTGTFGRLLCNSRHHHFVVDGPAQNGCPGEALTPPEIFLAGVVTCGVELVQVFAKDKNLPLGSATGTISALLDRGNQSRSDITLFNSVWLEFALTGVSQNEGDELVRSFQARCPLYGTLAAATPNLEVKVSTQAL
jgi:uncharacterized OsmC-like protein